MPLTLRFIFLAEQEKEITLAASAWVNERAALRGSVASFIHPCAMSVV